MTAALWREVLDALRSRQHCGPRDLERLRDAAENVLHEYDDHPPFYAPDRPLDGIAELIAAIDAGAFSATDPSSVAYWSAIAERELELEWPWRGDSAETNRLKVFSLNGMNQEENEGIIANADF